jgi:hypothetical protein
MALCWMNCGRWGARAVMQKDDHGMVYTEGKYQYCSPKRATVLELLPPRGKIRPEIVLQ